MKKKEEIKTEEVEQEVSEKQNGLDKIIITYTGLIVLPLTIMFCCWILQLSNETSLSNNYILDGNYFNLTLIAVQKDGVEDLIKSNGKISGDVINLIKEGKIFIVINSPAVQVLQKDIDKVLIEMTEGKYLGKTGWVLPKCIKNTKS